MDYKLLARSDPEYLNTEVGNHLQDGWVLYGTPFFGYQANTYFPAGKDIRAFCQAMVKNNSEKQVEDCKQECNHNNDSDGEFSTCINCGHCQKRANYV